MEKLFNFVVVLVFGLGLSAQDSLCVFKTNSGVLGQLNGKKQPLNKGDFLQSDAKVHLLSPSDVTLINANGEAFNLKQVGTYTYRSILEHNAMKDQKSLTSKYFKLIWNELLRKQSGKTIIGGVFRGETLMSYPPDSAQIASSKLRFKWNKIDDLSTYFVFIKNLNTDGLLKLSTNGNELTLYKNQPFFEEGEKFEWAVTTEEFPNLNNIPFHGFTLISRNDYEDLMSKYSDLINDLEHLGLSEDEIENSLCATYGLCKK